MEDGMTSQNDEPILRAYLLGELAPEEQKKIEERLLFDNDYVELLLIIEEELMDSYLRDTLGKTERNEFESYFLSTPDRRRKLKMAKALSRFVNDPRNEQPRVAVFERGRKSSWWLPMLRPTWQWVAAATVILMLGLGIWRIVTYESLADKGRAALQASLRESPIEARVVGFDWPPQRITLGEQTQKVADTTSMLRAERYLLDSVLEQQDEESHRALGQFFLVKGDFPKAYEQLELALSFDQKDAKTHCDLGTVLLSQATANVASQPPEESFSQLTRSLEHLNQALALDNSLIEALFNRALCRQHLELLFEAEADWQEYLRRDSNSPWADKARENLETVQRKLKQRASQNNLDVEQFLDAHRTGDSQTARKLVNRNREWITGQMIWWQLAGRLLSLPDKAQPAEVDELLRAMQYAGQLEVNPGNNPPSANDDPFVLELSGFYRSSFRQNRRALIQAHGLIDQGNRLFVSSQPAQALANYAQAREIFEGIGDTWEVMLSDLYIGNWHVQRSKTPPSPSHSERLAASARKRGYRWLLAQSHFALGSIYDRLGEHSKALDYTSSALKISEDIGDLYNTQRSRAQTADQYRKLGNYELSAKYLSRCLSQISDGWPGRRQMWRNCNQITQLLVARRYYYAAADFGNEALRLALQEGDLSMTYLTYTHLGLICGKQQDYQEAIRLGGLGYEAASRLALEQANPFSLPYASLQLGHLHRQSGDYQQALTCYDQTIGLLNRDERAAFVYDAHKGRLLCHLAEKNEAEAEDELLATLKLLEEYREKIREERNRNTFFDLEQSVYDAAIHFAYLFGNDQRAVFHYAEESRARSLLDLIATRGKSVYQPVKICEPLTLSEVQQRMPAETQLIEYIVLDDRLLICLVSRSGFSVTDVPVGARALTDKVMDFRRSILEKALAASQQAKELYDLLIKPLYLSAGSGERICVVPDKALNHLPFAALLSSESGNYLIDDFQLTVAPSSTVFVQCSERAQSRAASSGERLLIVGDPSFDRTAFPSLQALDSTRTQVERITEYYPSPLALVGRDARESVIKREMELSDVIHLASHYVVYEGSPMNSRLLLAQEPITDDQPQGSSGVLQADEIYALNLARSPLVVLSACQSGVEHYYNGEGMIGMSRVFIAAGAPLVVASLWQVDAQATGELMSEMHRFRKRGGEGFSTAKALRRAQLGMISAAQGRYEHPYYWAGFAAIGGNADF